MKVIDEDYQIGPEDWVWVGLNYQSAVEGWAAWIWWQNQWKHLGTWDTGFTSGIHMALQFAEVKEAGTQFEVGTPCFDSVCFEIDNEWVLWDQSISTTTTNHDGDYVAIWISEYYAWYMYKD